MPGLCYHPVYVLNAHNLYGKHLNDEVFCVEKGAFVTDNMVGSLAILLVDGAIRIGVVDSVVLYDNMEDCLLEFYMEKVFQHYDSTRSFIDDCDFTTTGEVMIVHLQFG